MSKKGAKDVKEEEKTLPCTDLEGTKPLATQVGGHRYGKNGRKVGILDRGNGFVLKALQAPPRGQRELRLYQTTFAPACRDQLLLELRHFLPPYYGTQRLDEVNFLVLNNISHHFTKPNVLDLKMGRVTYDPEADEKKKQHEMSKYPPLKELGFQITGMMMHDTSTGCPHHYAKDFCRSVTAETMLTDGLGKFFGLQDGHLRRDVVESLLSRLRRIERWFQMQRIFNFYASSLLIVYSSQDNNNGPADTSSQGVCVTAASAATTNSRLHQQHSPLPPVSSSVSQNPTLATTCSCLNQDPLPASPPVAINPGPDPHPAAGRPDTSLGSDFTSGNIHDKCTVGSTLGKSSAGQKRGYMERNEEGSVGQTALLCKYPRKEDAAEEDVAGYDGEVQASKTEDGSASLETKQEQLGPSETKQGGTEFSGLKADDIGLSECTKSAPEFSTKGGISESKGGAVCSGDKMTSKSGGEAGRTDPSPVEVRMIDFAHVFSAEGKDCNYLFGLQKLISLLEEMLKM